MNIYKHSQFEPNEFGHGGEKRTAQINQLLADAGIIYNEIKLHEFSPSAKNLGSYFRGLDYTKNMGLGVKNNYAIGRYLKQFDNFIKHTRPSFFIWESTIGYNLLLGEVLAHHGIPFITLPHNVEALINKESSKISGNSSPEWLSEEMKYLAYANKTFTISREEQWLCALYGVDALYLPYHPTEHLKGALLAIRQKRESHVKSTNVKELLILGTFHNQPTFEGYLELINNIRQFKDLQINVVGYGSETLTEVFKDSNNVRVWGGVGNNTLAELMISCDYAVIQQAPATGALTRISELLIAGIPIMANAMASRSHYDYEGITVYHDYNELLDLIHAKSTGIPPVLPRPAEEKHFISYLKSIIS